MNLRVPRVLRRAGNRRIAIATAVVVVFAVCIGLFIKSYHDSGPTAPNAAGGNTTDGLTGYPTDVPSGLLTSPGFFPTGATNITLPGVTISGIAGGGLHFAPGSQHKVTMSAHSAVPIGRVGYLIPTGIETAYGDVHNVGTSWSLTVTALGKPAYALVFIAAGAAGIPVTCTITVDGHVSNTATTSGAYGRAVCLG